MRETGNKKLYIAARRKTINDIEANITGDQRQIILGTLLGTGCIIKSGRNAYMRMRESLGGDMDWLRCKASELSSLARPHPFVKDRSSWHWVSMSNPLWSKYLSFCYKEGAKLISMEWLDSLRDLGLSIWFCDKGGFRNDVAFISMSRLNKASKETSQDYFNSLGMPVEMIGSDLRFTESTDKLWRVIGHRIPKFLRNKI